MKIGIVGDLHIAPTPPNRIDDYFNVGLDKITEISKNCDVVIFLGDIFTANKVDEKYVYPFIEHLRYCMNNYNVKFYTIVGNHDVLSEDENNLNCSSLGICKIAGVIDIILPEQPLIIGDNTQYQFSTIPVKYTSAKQFLVEQKNKLLTPQPCVNILLVHHEYETGTNCFNYKDFKDLGYNMVFLGHDHKPFDQGRIIYPEFTIYRSGSIMRNRADDYNFTRQLYYYVLENGNVSCQAVTTTPAQQIFSIQAQTRQNYNKQKFTESVDKVIATYKSSVQTQTSFSIKNILLELNTPQDIIEGIKKKHEQEGEVFQ